MARCVMTLKAVVTTMMAMVVITMIVSMFLVLFFWSSNGISHCVINMVQQRLSHRKEQEGKARSNGDGTGQFFHGGVGRRGLRLLPMSFLWRDLSPMNWPISAVRGDSDLRSP